MVCRAAYTVNLPLLRLVKEEKFIVLALPPPLPPSLPAPPPVSPQATPLPSTPASLLVTARDAYELRTVPRIRCAGAGGGRGAPRDEGKYMSAAAVGVAFTVHDCVCCVPGRTSRGRLVVGFRAFQRVRAGNNHHLRRFVIVASHVRVARCCPAICRAHSGVGQPRISGSKNMFRENTHTHTHTHTHTQAHEHKLTTGDAEFEPILAGGSTKSASTCAPTATIAQRTMGGVGNCISL